MPVTSPFSTLVSAFDQAGTAWGDDLQKAKRAVEMSVAGTPGLFGVGYGGSVTRVPGDVDKAIVIWLRPGTPETSLPLRVKVGDGTDGRPPRSIPVRVVRADPVKVLADRSNAHPESGLRVAESRLYAATGHLPYLKGPITGEASHIVYGANPMRTWKNGSGWRVHLTPASVRAPVIPLAPLVDEIPPGAPIDAPGVYEVWVEGTDRRLHRMVERLRVSAQDPEGTLVLIDHRGPDVPPSRALSWRLERGAKATLQALEDELFWTFSPMPLELGPEPVGAWRWTTEGVNAELQSVFDPARLPIPPGQPIGPGSYRVWARIGGQSVPLQELLEVSTRMPSSTLVLRKQGHAPAYRWAFQEPGAPSVALDLVPTGEGMGVWTYDPGRVLPRPPSRPVNENKAYLADRFGQAAPSDGEAWLREMKLGGFLLGGGR